MAVRDLVAVLPALATTDAERAQARAGVLAALPGASRWEVARLVAALRSISTVQSWLAWLANGGRRGIED